MTLEQVHDSVISCSKCGFCQQACPTYAITGREHQVARGRHQLVRGIIEQKVTLDRQVKDMLFECLMCNACYSNCFPAIKTDHIMALARHEYIKMHGQPSIQKYIFKSFLRDPAGMTRLLKLAAAGKNSGLSGLAQVLRYLGWFGGNLAHAERLLKKIPFCSLRERLAKTSVKPANAIGKIAYFVGCGINHAQPDVGMASVNVMREMGYEVEVLDNVCCGIPAYAYGDLDSVQWFMERNLAVLSATDADLIITDCASCASFLKSYPELARDPEQKELAVKVSGQVTEITGWIADNFDLVRFPPNGKYVRMTWHDPCHLAHHMKERKSARELLSNMSHVQFVEMEKADMCCGGAGSYNIAHPDKSLQLLSIKMDHVKNTDAKVLVTACPACIIQLSFGARHHDLPVEVKHITQVIADRFNS